MSVLPILLCAVLGAASAPVVLEDQAIRVEFDVELFTVRYIGAPGEGNWLEPLPVDDKTRESGIWLDPGALVTDVRPDFIGEAALRRGPGEILEKSGSHLIVLGPLAEKAAIRLMKEVRILEDSRVLYKVTLLSEAGEPVKAGLRNTMRLPLRSTVRIPRDAGDLKPLAGTESIHPAIVQSRQYWLMPVPPTATMERVVIGGFSREVSVERRGSGILTRKLVTAPGSPKDVPQGATVLCVLDTATQSYGVALQGEEAEVTPAAPLVLTEIWELQRPRR